MSDAYAAELAAVAHIDRDKAVKRTRQTYSFDEYVLDPDLTAGLTDDQKIVLAYGEAPPFGGRVEGNTVTVFTD